MANITVSDPDQLKGIVLDVLRENPEILKAAIKELLINEDTTEIPVDRKDRIRALIQEDFDQYESVFKALA